MLYLLRLLFGARFLGSCLLALVSLALVVFLLMFVYVAFKGAFYGSPW
jgi:hypothetical protein